MVLAQNKCPPIYTPICYNPYSEDLPKGTPNFGRPNMGNIRPLPRSQPPRDVGVSKKRDLWGGVYMHRYFLRSI